MRVTTDPMDAARAIAAGYLAAVPTETVYGLGARADDPHAIARIYAAKGRPANHPLIAHLASADALGHWGRDIPAYAFALAAEYWPGPLTLVVPRTDRAGDFITGGQDTVAVRVSSHPLLQAVLRELVVQADDDGIAIAAPSANRFGKVSPTSVAHVVEELGAYLEENDVVLDGGESQVGVESTIVDCTGAQPHLLRPGAVSVADIERVTGLPCGSASTVRASGTLASHYAPHATVLLVGEDVLEPVGDDTHTGLLATADIATPPGVVRLAAPADAEEYARVLYSALREADALGLRTVLAVPPDTEGVGMAVIDRLTRAAHRE